MFNYLASSNQNTRPRPLQDPASSAAGRGRRLGNNVDFLEAQRQRLVINRDWFQRYQEAGHLGCPPIYVVGSWLTIAQYSDKHKQS